MNVFEPSKILVPKNVDMEKWSVIACDQFTSQPEYWESVEKINYAEALRRNLFETLTANIKWIFT